MSGCCCGNAGRAALAPIAVQPVSPDRRRALQSDTIWLPGGDSFIGTDRPLLPVDGEAPCRPVHVAPFGLDAVAVTNRRFAEFIAATGHVTDAERFNWSFVFHSRLAQPDLYPAPVGTPWWRAVKGATWASPEGPGSTVEGREDHPAVHVSWTDAAAFATWAGGRLPTEAEWEHAARAGQRDPRYPWGDAEPDDTRIFCNIWQGQFPAQNTAADGWPTTAPMRSFAPNAFGFWNTVGNVWEWCADAFRIATPHPLAQARDAEAVAAGEYLQKGGSWLCHASYCHRYRIAARAGRSADTSAGHTGFRLAWDAETRV